MLIVAAALMPLVLFVAFQVGYAAREQRRATEAQALATAEQLIVAADGETTRIGTVLDALATSTLVKGSHWQQLASRFSEFAAMNSDLRGFEVRDTISGRTLLSVGAAAAPRTLVADGRQASRSVFVGYTRAGGCHCLLFQRGATSASGEPLTVVLLTDADIFLRLLPPPGKNFEVAAFNGPRGRFVARTLDSDKRFGELGSQYLRRAVLSGKPNGTYRGFTLEGLENYTAFARSRKTGWTAHVALNSQYIDAPARQFLASLVIAVVLSLVLAVLLVAFALRQIAEARRLSERLQQGQKLEALGQLTGGIAHDFNNLLTPIVGALDQLRQRDSLDERGRKLAAGALAAAQRAAKLTGQLLTFSRRQALQIAPVDVHRLASDLSDMVERTFGASHRFVVTIDERACFVASDAVQLEIALLNLALNARDASPEGAEVELIIAVSEISTGATGPDVLFTMRDHGAGMDEETQRRALEPFFTTKPVGQGTGLGLAQVLGVVEQSAGTVTIQSEMGRGTAVTLRLRASPPPTEWVHQPRELLHAVAQSALRLLVVDDDPAARSTVARTLEAEGHRVDSVASGTTALAALAQEPFDLMIIDYQMPVMTGAELLKEARKVRADIKALVVTGFADSDALSRSGVDCPILKKPFTSEQLLQAVQSCVRKTAQRTEKTVH